MARLRNANEPGFEASYENNNKSNMVNVDDLASGQKHRKLESTDRRNCFNDDFNMVGLPEMSESPRMNKLNSHEGFLNDRRRSGSFERPANPNQMLSSVQSTNVGGMLV